MQFPKPLVSALLAHSLDFEVKENFLAVNKSRDLTEEKIERIVREAGFCPLILEDKIKGIFALSIVPHQIPTDFFSNKKKQSCGEKAEINRSLIPSHRMTLEDISEMLRDREVVELPTEPMEDINATSNSFRLAVASSVVKGLDNILLPLMKDGLPIVEIESTSGYPLSQKLSSNMIKFQSRIKKAQYLKSFSSNPIFHLSVDDFCDRLMQQGKTIPLFLLHMDLIRCFRRNGQKA